MGVQIPPARPTSKSPHINDFSFRPMAETCAACAIRVFFSAEKQRFKARNYLSRRSCGVTFLRPYWTHIDEEDACPSTTGANVSLVRAGRRCTKPSRTARNWSKQD